MPSKPQRLFVTSELAPGASVELDPTQAHYLINVLRCKTGEEVLLFNGKDGEWLGGLSAAAKKRAIVTLARQTRQQISPPDLHYLFAPLKRARLDYMAQKATELGASRLMPVITRRTIAERVNRARLTANAVEAAEQCGVLWVPEVAEPEKLAAILAGWDEKRLLVFADEAAPIASPLAALEREAQAPARRADRAGGRVRGGGEGAPLGSALCPADLARSPRDAGRYRGGCGALACQCDSRRLALLIHAMFAAAQTC